MIYGAVAFFKSAFVLQLHEPVVSKPFVEHQKVKFKEMERHREEGGGVRERVWHPGSLCNAPHSNPGMGSTLCAPRVGAISRAARLQRSIGTQRNSEQHQACILPTAVQRGTRSPQHLCGVSKSGGSGAKSSKFLLFMSPSVLVALREPRCY